MAEARVTAGAIYGVVNSQAGTDVTAGLILALITPPQLSEVTAGFVYVLQLPPNVPTGGSLVSQETTAMSAGSGSAPSPTQVGLPTPSATAPTSAGAGVPTGSGAAPSPSSAGVPGGSGAAPSPSGAGVQSGAGAAPSPSSASVQAGSGAAPSAAGAGVPTGGGAAPSPSQAGIQAGSGAAPSPTTSGASSGAGAAPSPSAAGIQAGTGAAPSPTLSGATAGTGAAPSPSSASVPAGNGSAPSPSSLPDPSPSELELDLTGRTGYVQFRAFLGPSWRKADESGHWDFSGLALGAYTPHASTTVASGVGTFDTSVTVTDASTWPTSGSVWLGPNGSGQSWGLATYSGRTGNVLSGLERDPVDNEYSGIHSAGAVAHFWFPLSNNDGRFTYQETLDEEMAASTWRLELSGVNVDPGVLRPGVLALVQTRDASGGGWGAWTNFAVGWVLAHTSTDDYNRHGRWTVSVGGLDALPLASSVTGLRVGAQDLADSASAQADSTLAPLYKAIGDGTGEVTSTSVSVAPGLAVDGSLATGWINDRYIGEHNPLHTPSAQPLDAITSPTGITQVHVTKYPGQGDGYRWVELTWFTDWDAPVWLMAGIDHMVRFENGYSPVGNLDFEAGNRVILAENPSLFAAENPNHEATAVIDLRTVETYFLGNRKYDVTTPATGGTFTLTVSSQTTAGLAYNATAATVQAALAGLSSVGADNVRVAGSPGAWAVTFIDTLGQQFGPALSGNGAGLSGGTLTVTETSSPVFPFPIGGGHLIFNYLDPATGLLRLWDGPTASAHSQVAWGDIEPLGTWGNAGWVGATLASMGAGETARMVFNPTAPSGSADFWSVGRIATPGYSVVNGDMAWLLLELPGMGLNLVDALTDTVPGAGATIAVRNVAGPSVEGLPATGTIQVGNEQISYQDRDFVAGTVEVVARGANGTTPAVHSAGDAVLVVEGGVATEAWPVDTVRLRRATGLAGLRDFTIRSSSLALVRRPDETGYTADYGTLSTVAGHPGTAWTLDLSASPSRIRWLLIEILAMTDAVSRARLDEVDVLVDPDVQAPGLQMSSGTIAEAMEALTLQAGIPTGAIVDAGGTLSPADYTTVGGTLWPILADLASFGGAQIRVGRDSKLTIRLSRFLSAITPDGTWTRSQITRIAGERGPNLGVGQIEMAWRTPDDPAEETATYPPALARTGQTARVGTFVCADATVALAEARRRYWQARRPYAVTMALAFDARALQTGQIYTTTWTYRGRTEVRQVVLSGVNLGVENFGVESVVTGRQVDREDDK